MRLPGFKSGNACSLGQVASDMRSGRWLYCPRQKCVGRDSRERSEREVGRRTTEGSAFTGRFAPRSRLRDLTPFGLATRRPGFEPDPDVLAPSGRCARLVGFKSRVSNSRGASKFATPPKEVGVAHGLRLVEVRRPGFSRAERARSRATHDRRECVGRDLNRRKTDRSLRSRLRLPGFKSLVTISRLT